MSLDVPDRLNALPAGDAEAELLACCGSATWARRVCERRPFADLAELLEVSDAVWWGLARDDWLEAFAHHPKIGEKSGARPQPEAGRRWSTQEQAGTRRASDETLAELAAANEAYEQRFGYIFIVCATGKSAHEMLAIARARLANDPATELRLAAEEQRKITHLRLRKLLSA